MAGAATVSGGHAFLVMIFFFVENLVLVGALPMHLRMKQPEFNKSLIYIKTLTLL